ncbi:PREDICTED: pathogenesis-related protein 1A-like [Camelina sativa]|uniref:Pathogenesis-related protein 1A-like n=1 Tax=Camelina sativa TaxID=90675 RepID=A0ABM0XRP3_CAMSA|nr:PREDICTED: pathogenesis-related protein 1A-like [Camelina sativa]
MSLLKTNILLLFAISLLYGSLAEDLKQEFLEPQNEARNAVGLDPLVWDDEVAAYAASYANQRISDCALVHSNGPFGENIAMSSGEMSAEDAAGMWINEKQYYDYSSNTCNDPYGGTCLHYTQVVWRNTVRLGCAKVVCNGGGTFITCNYDPPGNYNGETPY